MADLRHGEPLFKKGYLYKEGKLSRMKHKRYAVLEHGMFKTFKDGNVEPSISVDLKKCRVAEGRKKYEIIIESEQGTNSFFADSSAEAEDWVQSLRQNCNRTFDNYYAIAKSIGSGGTSTVFTCTTKVKNEVLAVKRIEKKSLTNEDWNSVQKELLVLRLLRHPNIISPVDIFECAEWIHVVMEYVPAEAFNVVAEQGKITEREAAHFMRELLEGVAYLHNIGIVHRDLKPKNILCRSRNYPINVLISDFGLAEFLGSDKLCSFQNNEAGGTPGFMAPEVILKKRHSTPVDIFACGVILYTLLCGRMPFVGRSEDKVLLATTNGDYRFNGPEWLSISTSVKTLIKSMLHVDPIKRIKAESALRHPWLSGSACNITLPTDVSVLSSDLRQKQVGGGDTSIRRGQSSRIYGGASTKFTANMSFTGAIPTS